MAKEQSRREFEGGDWGEGLQAADLLHFIELNGFSDDWEQLGLDDEDLTKLQVAIMKGEKRSPVIAGTGGLRKMRFAPEKWRIGKRGAVRVCFCWLERFGIVLLITAYAKNEQSSLSARAKRMFRDLLRAAEMELETRRPRIRRETRKP